ncbi:8-oxo-dGTP pyrophosphatase MutT (NUDIX family) [Spinactinospora alkalitolerans]|uniref:8-oxo-dGTP pyrophosphatase MutT (NUDIX family) n=1 Tax=Spinactinospora alkalitolerans TaxID=687207 RepID=A0A852U1F8_9ACTN|nr:NUDIX domain-containing protein [Spinactinospora alkalitolerans]NYE50058.1 8-oxo-dGTP pyrophosphatase MutT (NUDIX family) [Spinactinospora alkalitolerans]
MVIRDERGLLLRNERQEWELPGGKTDLGETSQECVAREIEKETAWPVMVGPIPDSWMYHIDAVDRRVFIITYGCRTTARAPVRVSHEHKEAALVGRDKIDGLVMPEGYKHSVRAWFDHPLR